MSLKVAYLWILMTVASLALEANGGATKYTAMYVFGESMSDVGNNKYFIDTLAKADYLPFGIDFSGGPTGRLCNGKILVDIIAEMVGLPLLPSYADVIVKGDNTLFGVNYASAGAGILRDTGYLLEIHGLGLKKFLILEAPPIGCGPIRVRNMKCNATLNHAVVMFNTRLKSVVHDLGSNYPGSAFTYAPSSQLFQSLFDTAEAYGFKVKDKACCGVGDG
ncbi:GDSL esterase/lipase 7-like [Salvia hispanica]|uniref:GDSL esterase/lipase 7-like n=1 Tax=Salvia hispanica TaxID=49212 RepID=UPI002009AD43|nr:GDSL esterase/lipase 7-like [Salvia hispanica]